MKFIFILLFISNLIKAEYPYEVLNDSYNSIGVKASFEVSNMPPTKSQDGIGLCYGFSATTLLENYRCTQLQLNCLDKSQLISPLDVSSYDLNRNPKSIKESGNTGVLLSNFKNSSRKLAKEECANFSALVHKASELYVPSEGQGWKLLINAWNNFKTYNRATQKELVSCVATQIKTKINGLKTSSDQLQDAFLNAVSIENFLYKAILPTSCLSESNLLVVPDFEVNNFPPFGQPKDIKKLKDKIENVLMNNIPIELGICTQDTQGAPCPDSESHAITLFGIREVCSPLEAKCRTQVRVKNSYGWGWQRDHNDGWIDLQTLTEASYARHEFNNISWIQKPGSTLANKTLTRSNTFETSTVKVQGEKIQIDKEKFNPSYTRTVPEKWKKFKGIWKCENNTFLDHYEPGCAPYLAM